MQAVAGCVEFNWLNSYIYLLMTKWNPTNRFGESTKFRFIIFAVNEDCTDPDWLPIWLFEVMFQASFDISVEPLSASMKCVLLKWNPSFVSTIFLIFGHLIVTNLKLEKITDVFPSSTVVRENTVWPKPDYIRITVCDCREMTTGFVDDASGQPNEKGSVVTFFVMVTTVPIINSIPDTRFAYNWNIYFCI